MGVFAGPEINESGLVLAVDAGNTKSFKGAATTNIVSNASTMIGWSPYSNGNDGTFITEFGTTGYRMINRGSWNGIYKGVTLPSTGTYTVSAWFRYWGGASDNNGATVYTSGGGISDVAAALDKSKVGVWQRISMTNTYSTTGLTFYIISYGGTYGGSNSTWDVTMPQIEQNSYATSFVDGTRGSTVAAGGGLADLTGNGNNGELVNGVGESSANSGSLVFDGVNDYIIIPENSALNTQTPTVEVWVKTNATSQNGFWFEKGQVNTQYSLFQEGGVIQWRMNLDGSYNNLSTTTATYMNTSNWYQVVGTYTSGTRRLYINGTLVNSDAQTGTIITNANGMSIGAYGGFNGSRGYYYNGNIASVKIYNRALSAAEVSQNFNATRGRYGI
jgi:hypothetical protein